MSTKKRCDLARDYKITGSVSMSENSLTRPLVRSTWPNPTICERQLWVEIGQ